MSGTRCRVCSSIKMIQGLETYGGRNNKIEPYCIAPIYKCYSCNALQEPLYRDLINVRRGVVEAIVVYPVKLINTDRQIPDKVSYRILEGESLWE